jgi:hypothetical protein
MPQPARRRVVSQAITPTTTILLDRERHLLYTLESLMLIEEHTGLKMTEDIEYKTLSYPKLATLVWAGLIHEDESLLEEDFDTVIKRFLRLITLQNLMPIMNAVRTAMSGGGAEEATPTPLRENVSPSTGPRSGPSDATISGSRTTISGDSPRVNSNGSVSDISTASNATTSAPD